VVHILAVSFWPFELFLFFINQNPLSLLRNLFDLFSEARHNFNYFRLYWSCDSLGFGLERQMGVTEIVAILVKPLLELSHRIRNLLVQRGQLFLIQIIWHILAIRAFPRILFTYNRFLSFFILIFHIFNKNSRFLTQMNILPFRSIIGHPNLRQVFVLTE
jgi:hypothetical protein